MHNQWVHIPPPSCLEFLDVVRNDEHRVLFEPSICDVFKHPLEFFEGYDLIRISNKYAPPFVLLDYVSNGENHYYLDGSDHAIQTLCVQGSVQLSADNVLSYIDFYFSYVYERGSTVVFLRDEAASIQRDEKQGVFVIHVPLIYQNEKRKAVIHVHESGRIDIIDPAKVSFLDAPQGYTAISFIHPKSDSLLEQMKSLLSRTETGQKYIQHLEDLKVPVHILPSPNYQAMTINRPMIYMLMPAAQHTADYHQALLLAGAIHDMMQILGGYKRPSIDEEPALYFEINHDKNLKLACGICKIVEEYEALEAPEAVQAMDNLGLLDVYKGFRNDASAEALMHLYIQSLEKRGIIRKG